MLLFGPAFRVTTVVDVVGFAYRRTDVIRSNERFVDGAVATQSGHTNGSCGEPMRVKDPTPQMPSSIRDILGNIKLDRKMMT
uniref:Uncharacterized protein n=1 Tax=Romanomermis culicivorax TaxID=13658 RepID=A0A915IU30_ROMCU